MEYLCYIYYHSEEFGDYWINDHNKQINKIPNTIRDTSRTYLGFCNDDTFRNFNYSKNDWIALFENFITRDKADRFYFSYLFRSLFFLNITEFRDNDFKSAIDFIITKYPENKNFIFHHIFKYITFISQNKQQHLLNILNTYGYDKRVYVSKSISEAINQLKLAVKYKSHSLFFQLEKIYNTISSLITAQSISTALNNTENEVISLCLWLLDKKKSVPNFNVISKYFYYFNPNIRLKIIRRLFYDHKQNIREIDIEQLYTLINQDKKIASDIYLCTQKYQIFDFSLEILIESIRNYVRDRNFITLNGIIDLFLSRTVQQISQSTLNLKNILTICDGGLRCDKNFKGFLSKSRSTSDALNIYELNYFDIVNKESNYIQNINKDEICERVRTIMNKLTHKASSNNWCVNIEDTVLIEKIERTFRINEENKHQYNSSYLVDWKSIYQQKNIRKQKEYICYGNYSNKKDFLLETDFVWCMHMPCYRTAFDKNTNWLNYKLIDMLEILGYEMTEHKDCGLVANEEYRKFVDVLVKAQRIIERIRCKKCGHILFPIRSAMFSNDYNKYHCVNSNCEEYNNEIYINHCYKCHDGIIDSREVKKCSNGLYICPECCSCCDDTLFNRLANKYAIQNKDIPQRLYYLFGKGHNDKNIYYCPKCANKISGDEEICSNCNSKFSLHRYKQK